MSWDFEDWCKVLWVDESRVILYSNDSHQFIWKMVGSKIKDDEIEPTLRHGGSITFWTCMTSYGVVSIIFIDGKYDTILLSSNSKKKFKKRGSSIDWR